MTVEVAEPPVVEDLEGLLDRGERNDVCHLFSQAAPTVPMCGVSPPRSIHPGPPIEYRGQPICPGCGMAICPACRSIADGFLAGHGWEGAGPAPGRHSR